MAECEELIDKGEIEMPDDYVVGTSCLERGFEIFERNLEALAYAADSTRQSLLQCLPSLPKLSKMCVVAEIDRPGLNEDKLLHSTALAVSSLEFEGDDEDDDINKQLLHLMTHSSCEVRGVGDLLYATSKLEDQICVQHLTVGNGTLKQLPNFICARACTLVDLMISSRDLTSYASMATNLTHLSVSLTDTVSTYTPELDELSWINVLIQAVNLQSLEIYLDLSYVDGAWESGGEHDSFLSDALNNELTFRDLHTFVIQGHPQRPTNVRATWLKSFIDRHKTTFKHLKLNGVLIVNWYDHNTVDSVMERSLRRMESTLNLESAEVVLERRVDDHDKACLGENSVERCSGTCKRYMFVEGTDEWIDGAEVAILANTLGVAERDGKWDFGEFLMHS